MFLTDDMTSDVWQPGDETAAAGFVQCWAVLALLRGPADAGEIPVHNFLILNLEHSWLLLSFEGQQMQVNYHSVTSWFWSLSTYLQIEIHLHLLSFEGQQMQVNSYSVTSWLRILSTAMWVKQNWDSIGCCFPVRVSTVPNWVPFRGPGSPRGPFCGFGPLQVSFFVSRSPFSSF